MAPKYFKSKPKTLKRRNIKKRTGAKAQSKQIMSLSKQVTSLTKTNFEKLRTVWQMNSKPITTALTAGTSAFVCPIPYSPCDVLSNSPVVGSTTWADNAMNEEQTIYQKRMVFGYSDQGVNSNLLYHTGGKLQYQIYTNEPSYTKLGMFLVRPKKKVADQLITDRKLKGGTTPGSEGFLIKDVDFTVHNGQGTQSQVSTTFGSEINRKYWDVLYSREIAMSHPLGSGFQNNASANNTNPANNALVASGTIRVPAGGNIKNVSYQTQTEPANKSAPAIQQQFLDQRNEDSCYLIIIHNDVLIDNQTVDIGLVVNDYYKASV